MQIVGASSFVTWASLVGPVDVEEVGRAELVDDTEDAAVDVVVLADRALERIDAAGRAEQADEMAAGG
jgi:hypothetical protein